MNVPELPECIVERIISLSINEVCVKDFVEDYENVRLQVEIAKADLSKLDEEFLWMVVEKEWPETLILPNLNYLKLPITLELPSLAFQRRQLASYYNSRMKVIDGVHVPDV